LWATTAAAGIFLVFFLPVDPALHANDSVNGLGFSKSVIDWHPQGLQGHLALAIPLGACNVAASKATCTADPDALGTEVHRSLQGPLHGATETNPTLKLHRHVFGHELCIEFGLPHLDDVDLDLVTLADLSNISRHPLNLRTLASDHEAGTGGVERHANAVPGALNDDLGESCKLETTAEVLPHPEVFMQLRPVVLAFGVPLGTPIAVDN
jgi:hypothetical protein